MRPAGRYVRPTSAVRLPRYDGGRIQPHGVDAALDQARASDEAGLVARILTIARITGDGFYRAADGRIN